MLLFKEALMLYLSSLKVNLLYISTGASWLNIACYSPIIGFTIFKYLYVYEQGFKYKQTRCDKHDIMLFCCSDSDLLAMT